MLNDVNISKVRGGLGRREPSTDMISGLIANGVDVTGGAQLDTVYKFINVQEAEDLGLDDQYDETNELLVYEHIKEFFRVNPDGELWVLLKAQTDTFVNLTEELPTVMEASDGDINQVGIAYNPSVAVADTTDLIAAIAEAEIQATALYAAHKPVHVILEGKGFDVTAADAFRDQNAAKVSVMVGQDYAISNKEISSAFPYSTYAAVGTLLGAVSLAGVHVGVDYVSDFNMQGGTLQLAAMSNTKIADITASNIDTANDNGAIFFRKHVGIAGIYFNDTHNCVAATDDFAYIENQRTINKATRIVRATLLPDLGTPVEVDPNSGELDATFVQSMKAKVDKAITEQMPGELSGFTFFIDPAQNVLATSNIDTQLSLIPLGKARAINVTIGFTNPA